jgi:hypothetical protein
MHGTDRRVRVPRTGEADLGPNLGLRAIAWNSRFVSGRASTRPQCLKLARSELTAGIDCGWSRQKQPLCRQQRLKGLARSARAWIPSSELLAKLFASVHDSIATFDVGFRRESTSAFARYLESTRSFHRSVPRHTSLFAW